MAGVPGKAASALHLGKGKIAQVVATLGERIVAGEYPADAPLPVEADLARSLDVGRSVLREAIKVLAAKGMVAARPRHGTMILPRGSWNMFDHDLLYWHLRKTPRNHDLIRDILQVRRIIEPEAALLAAVNASESQRQAIRQCYEAMVAASGPDEATRADISFHAAVLAGSCNSILIAYSPSISAILTSLFAISIEEPEGFAGNLGAHEEVCQRIDEGDGEAARDAMLRMLQATESQILRLLSLPGPEQLFKSRR